MYAFYNFVKAMVEMKNYIKPEIEVLKFDIEDIITDSSLFADGSDGSEEDLQSADAFYGISAGEEGYLLQ